MKFKDYVQLLTKHLEENPEHENLEVIYFSDAEGNSTYLLDIDELSIWRVQNTDDYYLDIIHQDDVDEGYEGIPVICIN